MYFKRLSAYVPKIAYALSASPISAGNFEPNVANGDMSLVFEVERASCANGAIWVGGSPKVSCVSRGSTDPDG